MASMVVLIGAIPSLTSLVSLGGGRVGVVCTSSSGSETQQYSIVRRGPMSYRCGFNDRKRWNCGSSSSICTAAVVAEQGSVVSVDSAKAFSSNDDGGNVSDSEVVLKPAPRPVLKPKGESALGVSTSSTAAGKLDNADLEERNKVIESLGEVLEKAEKLETSRPTGVANRKESLGSNINNVPSRNVGKPANSVKTQKDKPLKSVWRKGDTVAPVPKVVKEPPKISRVNNIVKEESKIAPLRPAQAPLKPPPMLQQRPSVAPHPPPPVKRPTILKDVGALPKSPVDPATAQAVTAPDVKSKDVKSKERKSGPILIDKFASKKAPADPATAQAVTSPSRMGRGGSAPGRFRDDYRKKNAPSRRRLIGNDDADMDETSNVAIRGGRKGRKWSKASRKAARLKAAQDAAPVKVEILEVGEKGMPVEELAYNLTISEGEILGFLYTKGIKPDGVQTLNRDLVKIICNEYEVEVIDADPVKVEEMARKKKIFNEEDLDNMEDRPPVLTIMGHVDHGKTTLLDHIRRSRVAASEAGGITQGIGAYKVLVPVDGKLQPCVFLDTPGHEAFGAMRARGARVTDIAIIVVAADDGIRPQTTEAIAHAKAADVPIVIAINKIDKDGANPERVMQELSSIGLMPEDWGGDVPMVQISALKGENIDDLLETVMLVAELQELKANPNRNAKGTVIDAGLQKSRGPLATFIVQNGSLKKGDIVVSGGAYGKVRALFDHAGKPVDNAGPSMPVQVIGLNNVPVAGDVFEVVGSLDVASEMAEARVDSLRLERITAQAEEGMVTLSSLASTVSSGKISGLDMHQLNIILKVDVQGSIEAVRQALLVLPHDNVTLKFLLQAAGDISASDVDLAIASQAIILGFNVGVLGSVKSYADNRGVEIRQYKIIYELIDDVRKAMEGLLDTVEEQEPIGSAEVRQVFSSGSGRVAGCMVNEGKFVKGCGIQVVRKGKTVHVGILESLRRVKEIVKEVSAGLECGIGLEDFDDFEERDILEAFNTVEKKRSLEEASASMEAALEGVKTGL